MKVDENCAAVDKSDKCEILDQCEKVEKEIDDITAKQKWNVVLITVQVFQKYYKNAAIRTSKAKFVEEKFKKFISDQEWKRTVDC